MTLNRRGFVAAPLGLIAASAAARPVARRPDAAVRLWPGDPPGLKDRALADHVLQRSKDPRWSDRTYDRVRDPRIDVFRASRPNGAAMLVMPGGGYANVGFDKEGYDIAAWLNARGITAFVLIYRLPAQGWDDPANTPLADAQRAMRLIRHDARRYRIDPARVGAMGFSAGGHLCADLATRFSHPAYAPIDAADRRDARPAIAAPIYPVISMDPTVTHRGSRTNLIGADATDSMEAEHSADRQASARTPPCFLMHCEDDRTVPVANSLMFRAALKQAGVPVETHLFDHGGHGFGLGDRGAAMPARAWPDLWLAWAASRGFVG